MRVRSTGPNVRLSVEASGLSPATRHSPNPSSASPGAPVIRFTISIPGRPGPSTTITSPFFRRPPAVAMAQSPGWSVGRMLSPRTSTRKGRSRRAINARAAAAAANVAFRRR